MSPALNSIMRSHNVQFLPIQWRANLKLDDQESRRRAEDGLDNRFSLADVTLKQHVPLVSFDREIPLLTSSQYGQGDDERCSHRHSVLYEVFQCASVSGI